MTKKNSQTPHKGEFVRKTGVFIFIAAVVGLIGATASFWHMFFDRESTSEFLGFVNVRRFLIAFGFQFSLFTCSAYIFWMNRFIDPRYRQVKQIGGFVGSCFMFTASFFLIWIFWVPSGDFPIEMYYVMLIICSILVCSAVYLVSKLSVRFFQNYHGALKTAVEWILDMRSSKIPESVYTANPYRQKERERQHMTQRENNGLVRNNDGLHMLLSMSDWELDELGHKDIEDWLDPDP